MSETLRDLVVSLSLQSDNFTRNMQSVNKQIKEAERNLKYAEDMKASKRISDEHEAMKSSGLVENSAR